VNRGVSLNGFRKAIISHTPLARRVNSNVLIIQPGRAASHQDGAFLFNGAGKSDSSMCQQRRAYIRRSEHASVFLAREAVESDAACLDTPTREHDFYVMPTRLSRLASAFL
jgi:hypothetical protein